MNTSSRVTSLLLGTVLAVGLIAGAAVPASAQYGDEEVEAAIRDIAILSAKFPAVTPFPWTDDDEETAFLYADAKGIVHLLETDSGSLFEKWKSFPLDGSIRHIFAEDLDRDGRPEIVVYTASPRIYVWETRKFELLWESVEERFEVIHAMAIADVDRDPALELIVCADNKILYIDGIEFFREREGRDFVEPSDMIVGDVDNDGTVEIITNDGYVLDTSSLNIEWATDGFGYPISLFDIDDDGVPEIVGEVGGAVQFWDAEDQREIW